MTYVHVHICTGSMASANDHKGSLVMVETPLATNVADGCQNVKIHVYQQIQTCEFPRHTGSVKAVCVHV